MVGGMRTMVEKHHNVEHCIDLRPPPRLVLVSRTLSQPFLNNIAGANA